MIPEEVKQLSGKKNISCWESFKWEFKRRLARISNKNEGKKEVSKNQKTVIKENSDLTDKNVTDLCLDINPNTNLIQFIYSFLIFFYFYFQGFYQYFTLFYYFLFLFYYSSGFCPTIRIFRNYSIIWKTLIKGFHLNNLVQEKCYYLFI